MRKWRLKTKLVAAIMAINAIGMLVIGVTFINKNLVLLDSRLESRINTELDLMAQNIGAATLFRDKESAAEMLATLSVDSAIIGAELFAVNKSDPLAFYYRKSKQHTYQPVANGSAARSGKEVIVDGEIQGRLDLIYTSLEISYHTQQLFIFSLTVFSVATLLVLLGALRTQEIITGPIIALNQLSRRVAQTKDYSLRSDINKQDEIGELSREFNRMLKQVQDRDTMLEKQVQQRTAELEKLAEEFRHRAFHDALTGLPNRAFLSEYFDTAVAHARRNNSSMLLMLLDLDNFKTINDSLGHNFGDELLKIVSHKLKNSLRSNDIIVRLGGDEFIILIENADKSSDSLKVTHRLAEGILEHVQGDTLIYDQRIRVTASIGGAFFPDHGTDLIALKRSADIAMYSSKNHGRNRFSLFEASMENTAAQRLVIQNGLREALLENQLQVVYQPKVDARQNRVVGCEALVRWEHPVHGLLLPDMFIPFAEENSIIRNIDYFVLETACAQAYHWCRHHQPLHISVNLSPDHFTDHKIVSRIREVLGKTKLSPALLEVEITEAMLINDADLALDILTCIHNLGITISLDDFGTGYSSLNYLRTLPVDIVKLDRAFIKNILSDPHDARLVRGVIALAKGLELDTLAEGVETEAQMQHLLTIGCSLMQGYYYQKPCSAKAFEQWLLAWSGMNLPRPDASHILNL